jgi:hypothetical protein
MICDVCGGSGYTWYSPEGEWLGDEHDDLDELLICEFCGGTGYLNEDLDDLNDLDNLDDFDDFDEDYDELE